MTSSVIASQPTCLHCAGSPIESVCWPDAALTLAAAGFEVFPLMPRSKVPYRGTHGHRDATRDASKIQEWSQHNAGANLAVRVPPGYVVIDIDPRNGGAVTWRAMVNNGGHLFRTLTASTGGGGWHLWFCLPDSWRSAPINPLLGPGVEVKPPRRSGVTMPPSIHSSGRMYQWLRWRDPDPAPGWLLDQLRRTSNARPTSVPSAMTLDSKSRIRSLEDLERHDPSSPRSGACERRFLCPLPPCADHQQASHRSLSVNVSSGAWYCHRCRAGGVLSGVGVMPRGRW